jgi:hypothetical protein
LWFQTGNAINLAFVIVQVLTVGDMAAMVGVPVSVLSARRCVQVQDGVDSVFRTDINDAVKMFKAGFFEDAWVHIILKGNGL